MKNPIIFCFKIYKSNKKTFIHRLLDKTSHYDSTDQKTRPR